MPCNSGQVKFKTRRHAEDRGPGNLTQCGVKMRTYPCPGGGHFHLTPLSIEQFAWRDENCRIVAEQQSREIADQGRPLSTATTTGNRERSQSRAGSRNRPRLYGLHRPLEAEAGSEGAGIRGPDLQKMN